MADAEQDQLSSEELLMQLGYVAYNVGELAEAAAAFGQVLESNPARTGALLMRALILASEWSGSDPVEARRLLRNCLLLTPDNFLALNQIGRLDQEAGSNLDAVRHFERALAVDGGFAPAFNNLGVSLHRLGRRQAAIQAMTRAIGLNESLFAAFGNLGHVLAELGRWDEAVAAFRKQLCQMPDLAQGWHDLLVACHHADLLDEAVAAGQRARLLDSDDLEICGQLAMTLEKAGRQSEADRMYAEAVERRGTVSSPCRGPRTEARILLLLAQGAGNVQTRHLFDPGRFATIRLHLPPPALKSDLAALSAGLPPFDIIFSAVGEVGPDDAALGQLKDFLALQNRPVLNPPELIPRTGRASLPALLAGIPGLVVPATREVDRAEVEGWAAGRPENAHTPFLIRPVGTHGGEGLVKVERPDQIQALLRRSRAKSFYVSDFVDFRSADGFYRKYRFLFVDGAVFPYHLAIHDDWLVHYFRTLMENHPWMKAEEAGFLADCRSQFGDEAMRTIKEVASRLGLDYAGMDCALLSDGRVLLFEANACMLLHLDDSAEDYPYKHDYVPRIVRAIGDMVVSRLV